MNAKSRLRMIFCRIFHTLTALFQPVHGALGQMENEKCEMPFTDFYNTLEKTWTFCQCR